MKIFNEKFRSAMTVVSIFGLMILWASILIIDLRSTATAQTVDKRGYTILQTPDGAAISGSNPLPTTATLSGSSFTLTDGNGTTIGIGTNPLSATTYCLVVTTAATYTGGQYQPCTQDTKGNIQMSLGTALSGSYGTTTPDSVQIYAAPSTTYTGGQTGLTSTTKLFDADSTAFVTTIQNVGTPAVVIGICPFTPCVYATAPFQLTQYQFIPSSVATTWKGVWYAITGGSLGTAGGFRAK